MEEKKEVELAVSNTPDTVVNTLDDGSKLGVTDLDMAEYMRKKAEIAMLEKETKPFAEKLKALMLSGKYKTVTFGNIVASITFQNKAVMDEDKLVSILEERGFEDAIVTLRKPNPEMIPTLISEGKLTDVDITNCMIPNWVPVLKPKDVSKKVAENIVDKMETQKSKMF